MRMEIYTNDENDDIEQRRGRRERRIMVSVIHLDTYKIARTFLTSLS